MTKFLSFCDKTRPGGFITLFAAAIALSAGRIFDAFSDPLIGEFSDRTCSRWGRRRPLLFVSLPLMAVSFLLLWLLKDVYPVLNMYMIFFILFFIVNIYFFSYTLYAIPYDALLAEMGSSKQERLKISQYKTIFALAGIVLSVPAIAMEDTVRGALIAAALAFPALIVPLFFIREKQILSSVRQVSCHKKQSLKEIFSSGLLYVKESFTSMLQNPAFLIFSLMIVLIEAGSNGFMKNLDYIIPGLANEYDLNRDFFYHIMLLIFIAATVTGIFFWKKFTETYHKVSVIRAAVLWMVFFLPFMAFLGKLGINVFAEAGIYFFFIGFGYSAMTVLTMALVADFIDEEFQKHHVRREARFYGFYAFVRKAGFVAGALFFSGYTTLLRMLNTTKIVVFFKPYRLTGILFALFFFAAFLLSKKVRVEEKKNGDVLQAVKK